MNECKHRICLSVEPYLATTGGVVLAGGTVAEILPNPLIVASQYNQPSPVVSSVPYQTVSLGAPAAVIETHVVPHAQATVAAIPQPPENNTAIASEEKTV